MLDYILGLIGGIGLGVLLFAAYIMPDRVMTAVDKNQTIREFAYENCQSDYKEKYTDWEQFEKKEK